MPSALAVTSAKPLMSANALTAESVAPAVARKYTRTCGNALPSKPVTFTRSFCGNVVLTGVLCAVPLVSAMNFGKSAMFRSKRLAGVVNTLPCTLAFTT